jgi:hypothetical protein
LPAGLIVSVALAQKIDPATGAAGDLVKGTLTKPISVPSLGLTIPPGTPLVGRITELLVQYDFETQVTLGLKWESIEFSGIKHDVEMALRSQVAGTAKVDDVQIRGLEHGEGLFVLFDVPGKYQIPAGFESEWITASPNN